MLTPALRKLNLNGSCGPAAGADGAASFRMADWEGAAERLAGAVRIPTIPPAAP